MNITVEQATQAIAIGIAKINDLKEPSCMAIVDEGGNLIAFMRSNSATFGTAEVAINKAYTAAAFRCSTADLQASVQPGGEIFGLMGQRQPFVCFGGGLPILRNGRLVGAVGVSGGPVAADEAIALAMADSLHSFQQT